MQNTHGAADREIHVRAADLEAAADREALLAILDEYLVDPAIGGRAWPPAVREAVAPGLAAHGAVCFLAWSGPRAIGAAVCLPSYSTFKARPVLNVHDLAVAAGQRGAGVGRRLLEAVEAEARARGCCKITLEVRDDNDTARHLYDRFGFGRSEPGEAQSPTWFLEKGLAP